jgi:hypothetical protein
MRRASAHDQFAVGNEDTKCRRAKRFGKARFKTGDTIGLEEVEEDEEEDCG